MEELANVKETKPWGMLFLNILHGGFLLFVTIVGTSIWFNVSMAISFCMGTCLCFWISSNGKKRDCSVFPYFYAILLQLIFILFFNMGTIEYAMDLPGIIILSIAFGEAFTTSKRGGLRLFILVMAFISIIYGYIFYPSFYISNPYIVAPVNESISLNFVSVVSSGSYIPWNCYNMDIKQSTLHSIPMNSFSILPEGIVLSENGNLSGSFQQEFYFSGECDLVCSNLSRFYLGTLTLTTDINQPTFLSNVPSTYSNENRFLFYIVCFWLSCFLHLKIAWKKKNLIFCIPKRSKQEEIYTLFRK